MNTLVEERPLVGIKGDRWTVEGKVVSAVLSLVVVLLSYFGNQVVTKVDKVLEKQSELEINQVKTNAALQVIDARTSSLEQWRARFEQYNREVSRREEARLDTLYHELTR